MTLAAPQYDRLVLALQPDDLEKFILSWLNERQSVYIQSKKFSGTGDAGRDVVGFLTNKLHEGPWHNYQCKQYGTRLGVGKAIEEIGKILYFANQGIYTPPEKYYFVAPRGVTRTLDNLLCKPQTFKMTLIECWDEYCLQKIVEKQRTPLTTSLKAFIEAYDFSRIMALDVHAILNDDNIIKVLEKWFKQELGPAPVPLPPSDIQPVETYYINQLIEAYKGSGVSAIKSVDDLTSYPHLYEHLMRQRERFYAAEAFKNHFRDNTPPEVIKGIDDDVYYGVIDVCNATHANPVIRVNSVMTQAASVQVSGILAKHTGVPVRQGICHQHANHENPKLKWNQ